MANTWFYLMYNKIQQPVHCTITSCTPQYLMYTSWTPHVHLSYQLSCLADITSNDHSRTWPQLRAHRYTRYPGTPGTPGYTRYTLHPVQTVEGTESVQTWKWVTLIRHPDWTASDPYPHTPILVTKQTFSENIIHYNLLG